MNAFELLDRLIGFETITTRSNMAMVDFVTAILGQNGIPFHLVRSADGAQANVFATIGPSDRRGVMLSGHMDVVPVAGQSWNVPPFRLTAKDGKLFGRGAADMKGFLACALSAAIKASRLRLEAPLHLALSYDEEIGCIGVRSLIADLQARPYRPALCIVGEPTGMQIATGHKGKVSARAICSGREAHSSLAPLALNALHLGGDFLSCMRDEQRRLAREGASDRAYDVPYTTVHAGRFNGGVALNIVPARCEVDFEIRNVAGDDPEAILQNLRECAESLIAEAGKTHPEAAIGIEVYNAYPGLDTPDDSPAVAFVRSVTGSERTTKVAFGTEGGLFSRDPWIRDIDQTNSSPSSKWSDARKCLSGRSKSCGRPI
jgi:acetylornithine deacetylase